MSKLYSKSTGGFYDTDVHSSERIPSDAIPISEEMHLSLLDAQATGKIITADSSGLPTAQAAPSPAPKTYAQLRQEAYPNFFDQLDSIWHAIDQGLPLDKTSAFYLARKSVKDEFPKPTS